MICSPFEATILWSVGQGDHKTSAWPTTSALEPLWGCAKHTQKHTHQSEKNIAETYAHMHTVYRALADGRIMSFPQADRLCQQPVLRHCVFTRAKSITGSHILRNTDWLLNQKHDSNQQTWANDISSAQSANQTSRINPGKSEVWSRSECSCRHFWATGGATTKGGHKHKTQRTISYSRSRVLLCTGPALLRAKAPRLKGSFQNSWLSSS